jgi:hypothetical protein
LKLKKKYEKENKMIDIQEIERKRKAQERRNKEKNMKKTEIKENEKVIMIPYKFIY